MRQVGRRVWTSWSPTGAKATLLESYEGRGGYVSHVGTEHPAGSLALHWNGSWCWTRTPPPSACPVAAVAPRPRGAVQPRRWSPPALAPAAPRDPADPPRTKALRFAWTGCTCWATQRHADLTSGVTHEGGGETSQVFKGVAARDRVPRRVPGPDHRGQAWAPTGPTPGCATTRCCCPTPPRSTPSRSWRSTPTTCSCTHGNTVGALDEEALFYIRSRGVPEARSQGAADAGRSSARWWTASPTRAPARWCAAFAVARAG